MAPLDEKTSEVQGSSRTVFQVVKIVGDLIDDELQVSDAHKCAGKKVDNGKRAGRVVASAVSKGLVQLGKGNLGEPNCNGDACGQEQPAAFDCSIM